MRKKTIDTIPVLSDPMKTILSSFSQSRSLPASLVKRSKIILLSSQGFSNQVVATKVGLHYNHVATWRNRFLQALPSLRDIESGTPDKLEDDKVYSPAIFCVRTWIFTGSGYTAPGKADLWAFELCPSFCGFGAFPAHDMALPANRDTIIVDCKVIFVYGRPSPVSIQVNERNDPMVTAVFIVRHGIMC